MSNSANKLSSANRAMLVGAIAGGSATIASQWKEHKAGNIDTNEMATSAAKSALKTAAIAGATTYVAEKMARSPCTLYADNSQRRCSGSLLNGSSFGI